MPQFISNDPSYTAAWECLSGNNDLVSSAIFNPTSYGTSLLVGVFQSAARQRAKIRAIILIIPTPAACIKANPRVLLHELAENIGTKTGKSVSAVDSTLVSCPQQKRKGGELKVRGLSFYHPKLDGRESRRLR
jgi:hypothetical protein